MIPSEFNFTIGGGFGWGFVNDLILGVFDFKGFNGGAIA